jgi:2-methylcitrate dehydratase PrpD
MGIARELADFTHETKAVPEATRIIAISAVFDLMTAAVVGFNSPGGRAARTAAPAIWGAGPAASWFSTGRLTVPGAAFANSAIASMLDLDDGHRAAAGHPGASIIPAVFATADAYNVNADRVIVAIALGYEIAVRIASARDINSLDTLVTGPWCGQGAAAAAGWLRGLSPGEIEQAIAIAGSSAPNLAAVAYSRVMGNHVKEGIPWATATGLAAVDLAVAGFTGPVDLFENERLYHPSKLTDALGHSWLIDGIYFKPYSCCRWAHAAIEALLELQAKEDIATAAIEAIEVHTFGRALRLNNDLAPDNLEAAQYSVPFCLALATLRGTEALLPLEESSLNDPEVLALAKRIKLVVDPELDAMFPNAVPARVVVTTPRGHSTHTVLTPKGEPANPMTWANLESKFDTAVRPLIDPSLKSALLASISALRGGNILPLRTALASPMNPNREPLLRVANQET